MEKVTDGRAEEVWRRLISSTVLKDISSMCSTERELVNTCADIYVNCYPDSSWEEVACQLYREEETAAVEEVRSYLNPRGRFSQWVWFVV
jgi:serine/threonine-protein kinase RIO1